MTFFPDMRVLATMASGSVAMLNLVGDAGAGLDVRDEVRERNA